MVYNNHIRYFKGGITHKKWRIIMNNNNRTKADLDRKIQENNVAIEQYKYDDYEKVYKRFESGPYSSIYTLTLDKKGYLIETYSSDEQGVCDSSNITVYNNGKEYSFTTMDDSYEYECKDEKLYYVGYMENDVYGSVYGERCKYEGKFSNLLYENMERDSFEQKKSEILKNFMEKYKEKTIEELNKTRKPYAYMEKNDASMPRFSEEQKQAAQEIMNSKYDLPKEGQLQSAYKATMEKFSNIIPENGAGNYEYDGPDFS